MANIINLDQVSKAYDRALLADVSLGLADSDTVGVVGLNGSGKTTLLRLLTKAEQPDTGRVTHRRDLRVAALPQALDLPPDLTIKDMVLGTGWLSSGFGAEHEWAGDAGIRTILTGLGMPGLGLDRPVGPLSGGERRRVALAALLIRDSDLLVLDEPTNHLDLAAVGWLAEHLRARRGALVVVTHDRWFLDEVCSRTWEVADQTVRSYEGGFAAWTLARAEREQQTAAAEQRRQNLLRKEVAWLRRGPKARTSKPKFRMEAADALIADVPPPRDTVSLRRLATARLGKDVYELEGVTVRLGSTPVLSGVDWMVGPGDRIGVVGANGAGKSTLLRLLAGQLAPTEGRLRTGRTVRSAYLSQELVELPGALRVLESVEEVARRVTFGGKDLTAAQLAEMFGLAGERLWTPVAELSGGERRRLQLLRLLATEPNVLLLDEPTNDLDTDTLAALEDLLDDWPGTLVVASHDRYLIERVTDAVYAMLGDGRLTHLPAGPSSLPPPAPVAAAGLLTSGPSPETPDRRAPDRRAPDRPGTSAGEARAGRKELGRLERQVNRLEQREVQLQEQLAHHATDHLKLSELDAELRSVRAEREQAEEAWLALADQLT